MICASEGVLPQTLENAALTVHSPSVFCVKVTFPEHHDVSCTKCGLILVEFWLMNWRKKKTRWVTNTGYKKSLDVKHRPLSKTVFSDLIPPKHVFGKTRWSPSVPTTSDLESFNRRLTELLQFQTPGRRGRSGPSSCIGSSGSARAVLWFWSEPLSFHWYFLPSALGAVSHRVAPACKRLALPAGEGGRLGESGAGTEVCLFVDLVLMNACLLKV